MNRTRFARRKEPGGVVRGGVGSEGRGSGGGVRPVRLRTPADVFGFPGPAVLRSLQTKNWSRVISIPREALPDSCLQTRLSLSPFGDLPGRVFHPADGQQQRKLSGESLTP